jgi:hypothetical protein
VSTISSDGLLDEFDEETGDEVEAAGVDAAVAVEVADGAVDETVEGSGWRADSGFTSDFDSDSDSDRDVGAGEVMASSTTGERRTLSHLGRRAGKQTQPASHGRDARRPASATASMDGVIETPP